MQDTTSPTDPLPTRVHTQEDFARFLEHHVATVRPLVVRCNETWWQASTTGLAHFEEESARLEADLRKIYADPTDFSLVAQAEASGVLTDPLLARQARLLYQEYLANQMPPADIERMVTIEKEIESEFNNWRARIGDEMLTDNQIKDVLRDDVDSARRRAVWEGSKRVGARVAERVLTLVRMRNEAARRLGFRDYYALHLELQDLDEARLFGLLDELAALTEPLWAQYKADLDASLAQRFGVPVASLRPWHYSDPFFQELPRAAGPDLDAVFAPHDLAALTQRFYAAIGLEVSDILARSDLYERAGKSQHAFCICVDHEADVRVLCNLKPDEQWASTMLHEFGHAVYDKHIDAGLPFLLREPAHILMTEAVAMYMGRLTKNERWLARYADVPAAQTTAMRLDTQLRHQLLVFVRWGLVVAHFEQAMYADPDQDLNRLWWDLCERYQGVTRPEGRDAPDWAAKIHLSTAPVYYQNYLLGEMVASQMQARLLVLLRETKDATSVDVQDALISDPRVGRWFSQHLFHAGNRAHWEATLQAATGEPLNPRHLTDQLRG